MYELISTDEFGVRRRIVFATIELCISYHKYDVISIVPLSLIYKNGVVGCHLHLFVVEEACLAS